MFLKPNSAFPPPEWADWYDKYNEWSTWYSGEPIKLINYYRHKIDNAYYKTDNIFWGRADLETYQAAINCPLAQDIAKTSSNLLFSEMPIINYNEQERIKDFIKENNLFSLFQEGAEISAALSGCFFKLDVNRSISSLPLLSIITPLQAFPIFAYGRLIEVLFWREVKREQGGNVVYRLFESRNRSNKNQNLNIQYQLCKGTSDRVGTPVEINSIEETEGLEDVSLNMQGLGVVYIPNMKPNTICPNSALGINDYSGSISMLDSLDLAWSSMIRDIEIALGQLLIDEELLCRDQNLYTAEGKSYLNNFSKFQKTIIKLNFDKKQMAGDNTKPIEAIQFEMRIDEHLKSIEGLTIEIIGRCGYSPNTFGYNISGAGKDSGTALKVKERKSLFTRAKKENYWINAIYQLLMQMQYLDNATGLKIYTPMDEITVNLEDSILIDIKEQSETIRNLDQAKSISTYLKIKMQHPNWNETKIEEEVNRIQNESGLELNSEVFNV